MTDLIGFYQTIQKVGAGFPTPGILQASDFRQLACCGLRGKLLDFEKPVVASRCTARHAPIPSVCCCAVLSNDVISDQMSLRTCNTITKTKNQDIPNHRVGPNTTVAQRFGNNAAYFTLGILSARLPMELIAVVLSSLSIVGLVIAGLLLRSYLPSYVAEKGKNLASKEDLAHLTDLVESIKALYTSELERLKANLLAEGQITERRRRVYEEMCITLRVFISGHDGTPEMKERFHSAYASAWLWASDGVLVALNHFIALQVQRATDPASVDQPTLKDTYTAIVVEMRKDVGFASTVASGSDYQFVQF